MRALIACELLLVLPSGDVQNLTFCEEKAAFSCSYSRLQMD